MSPIILYTTRSGSVYEVNHGTRQVRQVKRSSASDTRRIAGDWRTFESVSFGGIGTPLEFFWGTGRDEHSATAVQIGEGPDACVLRVTQTTPVIAIGPQ